MAIGTTNAYSGPYTPNGATTAFPFTFNVLSVDQVSVILRDSDGNDATVSTSLYSVSLTGAAPSTGTVTFGAAPTGAELYVLLSPAFTQDIEFADGAAWLAGPVNDGYDQSALRDQVLKRDVTRALKVPVGEAEITFPGTSARANKFLGFAGDGTWALYDVPEGATISAMSLVASEAIAAGDFVNIHDVAGVAKIRKIDADDPTKDADGFVLTACASGAAVFVMTAGINTAVTVTSAGEVWASTTAGGFMTSPLDQTDEANTGKLFQSIGKGIPGVGILFNPKPGQKI